MVSRFLKAPTWLGLPLSLLILIPSFVLAENVTVDFFAPNNNVTTSGQWSTIFTGSGQAYGTTVLNASFAFNFTGTDLYVFMERGAGFGSSLFVLDGKSYNFDGFSAKDENNVCGLCISNLPDQQHSLNMTFNSIGRSTEGPNDTVVAVSDLIYTNDSGDNATTPSTNSGPSGPASPAPSTGSSNTVPLAVVASIAVVIILVLAGVAIYFYRRSRYLARLVASRETTRGEGGYGRLMVESNGTGPSTIDTTTRTSPLTPSSSSDPFSASSLQARPSGSRSTTGPPRDSVTRNMDVLTAQVQRLANILEDPVMPPPAYDGDHSEE